MATLLKRVETHVRIMGQEEQFNLTNTSVQFPSSTKPMEVTRMHRKSVANKQFYNDVVSKAVGNALAGQSSTVMFCGPSGAGRSYTMYGDTNDAGMLVYAAHELLKEKGCIVHVAAFHVNGEALVDSRTNEPITAKDFVPPLGPIPLGVMTELTSDRGARVIPKEKSLQTSCFIQLQVYRTLTLSPHRCAFAFLNFVDLAPFQAIMPPDVLALQHTVERVAKGGNPVFSQCQLTRLLETTLVGCTTLLAIGTIVGKSSSLEYALKTLEFLCQVGKVNQVVSLVHILPPKYLTEAVKAIESERSKAAALKKMETEKAYSDTYHVMANTLQSLINQATLELGACNADVEKAREEIQGTLEDTLREINSSAAGAEECVESMYKQAHQWNSQAGAKHKEAVQLHDRIQDLDRQDANVEEEKSRRAAQAELEMNALNAVNSQNQREMEELHHQKTSCLNKDKETMRFYDTERAGIRFDAERLRYEAKKIQLDDQKHFYEEQLEKANLRARNVNSFQRIERERKTKIARVTNADMRVTTLRSKVKSESPSVPELPGMSAENDQDSVCVTKQAGTKRKRNHVSSSPAVETRMINNAD